MRIFFILALMSCYALTLSSCKEPRDNEAKKDENPVHKGYNLPVRPGIPGEQPFWNQNAIRFMYAPAFHFEAVEGAVSYRFTLTADSLTGDAQGKTFQFEAEKPWAALTPVWEQLPVGYIGLKVEALDSKGGVIASIGERAFYRAAEFKGSYREAKMPYKESALKALKFYFGQPFFQNWQEESKIDPSYGRSAYPSKTLMATFHIMQMFANTVTDNEAKQSALSIARNAADLLIEISEPPSSPINAFPPSYLLLEKQRELQLYEYTVAQKRQNHLMMTMPAHVGLRMLDLFNTTGDSAYYHYALKIAESYDRNINEEGTWPLLINTENLEAVKPNMCIPSRQLLFFERLREEYGIEKYKKTETAVLNWLMENPAKDWRWEGQFEDVEPGQPYENMSKTQACEFVRYLALNADENPDYMELASELMRYVEDQFVVWERPVPVHYQYKLWDEIYVEKWLTPCALEQYEYYLPIDHSAASVMSAWLELYVATGDGLYLQKAQELGNTCTHAQADDGRYPTYWIIELPPKDDWLNCAAFMIETMLRLDSLKQSDS